MALRFLTTPGLRSAPDRSVTLPRRPWRAPCDHPPRARVAAVAGFHPASLGTDRARDRPPALKPRTSTSRPHRPAQRGSRPRASLEQHSGTGVRLITRFTPPTTLHQWPTPTPQPSAPRRHRDQLLLLNPAPATGAAEWPNGANRDEPEGDFRGPPSHAIRGAIQRAYEPEKMKCRCEMPEADASPDALRRFSTRKTTRRAPDANPGRTRRPVQRSGIRRRGHAPPRAERRSSVAAMAKCLSARQSRDRIISAPAAAHRAVLFRRGCRRSKSPWRISASVRGGWLIAMELGCVVRSADILSHASSPSTPCPPSAAAPTSSRQSSPSVERRTPGSRPWHWRNGRVQREHAAISSAGHYGELARQIAGALDASGRAPPRPWENEQRSSGQVSSPADRPALNNDGRGFSLGFAEGEFRWTTYHLAVNVFADLHAGPTSRCRTYRRAPPWGIKQKVSHRDLVSAAASSSGVTGCWSNNKPLAPDGVEAARRRAVASLAASMAPTTRRPGTARG